MILFTHAAIGAAVAEAARSPALVFTLAFASHFVLDAIPHWDYHLRSVRVDAAGKARDIEIGRDFLFDFLKIGADAILGTALALYMYGYLLTPGDGAVIFIGIVGGLLPDFLQFAYFKIRREPFVSLQRFHRFAHAKHELKGRYIAGSLSQALLILAVFWAVSGWI